MPLSKCSQGRALFYIDTLPRNFTGNPMTGPGSKVRILHSLFGVNVDPDAATIVVGIFEANKVAPFKATSTVC
jgi:hypothetical protein